MKKSLMRLFSAMMALAMLTGCAALAEPAEADAPAVEGITYPYLRQFTDDEKDPVESEMKLYFVDGGDIPYAALSEYMTFLSGLLSDLDKGDITYEITRLEGDGGFQVSRPDNGSTLLIYPDRDTLVFDNFNTFTQTVGTRALVSTLDMPEPGDVDLIAYARSLLGYDDLDTGAQDQVEEILQDEQKPAGESDDTSDDTPDDTSDDTAAEEEPEAPKLFALKSRSYVNRAGSIITLNLSDYDIDIVEADGECYIPFHTLNDLLVSDLHMHYVFDGEKVLGIAYHCSLIDEADTVPKHAMSEAYAAFNYNELRLLLDCRYGLKPEHGIEDFDQFLGINTELRSGFESIDAQKADVALIKLLFTYFDDMHSTLIRGSYMYDRDQNVEDVIKALCIGPSIRKYLTLGQVYKEARKAVYRAWVPGYEEVGDTAFITFDSFDANREDYFDSTIDRDDPQDTIDLIIYANNQIKREGSPVKNIVLDLSNNGGGSVNAAVFVISWFLGEADIALRDTFTGAETNAMYLADVNLDGQFDSADSVGSGYKLYCLTSNSSFSCGNLVPAAFRSSGKVTLVGQTTGGGSCVVLPCTTAAGTLFQISGNKQISIIKNGSFYNADTGIVPDIALDKPESFYDREALVEYLHGLK